MIPFVQHAHAEPYPQNKGTEPCPYFPDTDNPDTENKDTNNNSNKINNFNTNKSSQRQTDPEKATDGTPTDDKDMIAEEKIIVFEKAKAPTVTPIPQYQQAEAAKFNRLHYSTLKAEIQENVEYESLISQNGDREFIDSLIQVILDVILTESPDTVKIGQELKSRDIVKSIYLSLNEEHIQHVVDKYKEQHHQINNKSAYLRTMLYNAFQELEPHFANKVRSDGIVW